MSIQLNTLIILLKSVNTVKIEKLLKKSDKLWVYANEVHLKTVYLLLFILIFHVTLLIK